jgi:hypothetical protein
MKNRVFALVVVVVGLTTGLEVQADVTTFKFSGGGVSASGSFTYELDTVAGDPVGAYAITGVSGTFSDTNIGLTDVAITGLLAIDPVNPPNPAPFPASFSSQPVANSPTQDPSFSYDNLYYPGGSPITCPGYPGAGGYLDVFGMAFILSNGNVVDVWSNGVIPGVPAPLSYGVLVMSTDSTAQYLNLDYVPDSIQLTVPEPGSLGLAVTGLLAALGWRRWSSR